MILSADCRLVNALLFAVIAVHGATDAKPPFAIEISAAQNFRQGATVEIDVKLTNNSRGQLDMSGSFDDSTGLNPNYIFDVRRADGTPVPKRVDPYSLPRTGSPFNIKVAHGKAYVSHQVVGLLYDMSAPGIYIIRVSRRLSDKKATEFVTSNAITIDIIAAK